MNLLGALLVAAALSAQDLGPTIQLKVPEPQPYTIRWSSTDYRSMQAELKDLGDFTFYDEAGKLALVLKRDTKGDPIHELLATMLVRQVVSDWTLKDWRDWKPSRKP